MTLDQLAQLDLMAGQLLPIHPTARHPRTGERLQALGYRRNGTPIWPILGAADDDGDEGEDSDDGEDGKGKKGDDEDDDEELGPKGQRALEAEKQKRRDARAAQRKAEADLVEARAEIDRLKGRKKSTDDDDDEDDDKGRRGKRDDERRNQDDEATKQAEARANAKIVRAEARTIAATLGFIDPSDASAYLDVAKYSVDDDGEVEDVDDLRDDLKKLLEKKPHLKDKRFKGGADGGRQGEGKKPDPGPGQARMRAAYESAGKR